MIDKLISIISDAYNNFLNSLPPAGQLFVNLLLLAIIITIYGVFVWKFYTFVSTKDILKLNLAKYNKLKHPLLAKLFAMFLYIIEYVVILPLLIVFWFFLFTVLLTLVGKGLEIEIIVLISAIVIMAVRITSYIPDYGEIVAVEIAKIVPITLLGLSITDPQFFELGQIAGQLTKLPTVMHNVGYYLVFIIVVELVLRGLTLVFSVFKKNKEAEEEQE